VKWKASVEVLEPVLHKREHPRDQHQGMEERVIKRVLMKDQMDTDTSQMV
jgi:hypothetical protein